MQNFIDREKATEEINAIIDERTTPWLVLSGGSKIGKTEFAKKIAKMNGDSIYCDPKYETIYACAFVKSLQINNNIDLESKIYEFAKQNPEAINIYKSLGLPYVSPLQKPQLKSFIKLLIQNDVSSGLYSFAHYLGEIFNSRIKCVFLDDFHRCEFDSYNWILAFWEVLSESKPTIVVICNFEFDWESHKVFNIFQRIISPVNIEKFDSETAFYDVLKEYFIFENDINLLTVSKQLFSLFDGSSRLLFEVIKLLEGKTELSNDEEKMAQIISMAHQIQLRCFNGFSKSHMLVMRLLAFSPSPISKNCIIDILELNEPIATEIISKLYDSNFISQTADEKTGKTLYSIADQFLKGIIKSECSANEQLFYKTKIYRAIQHEKICANSEQIIDLAIELGEKNAAELVIDYFTHPKEIYKEKKANYIDKLINNSSCIPELLVSPDIAHLLYTYGYYQSAKKVIDCWASANNTLDYNTLILLGDIQHVLLSPTASQTYKKAANIEGITISDKLKALNRQIMALNQEHQEVLAKDLYIKAFLQYESIPCPGLVELYRNTNNSFGYNEAINYTIKGYLLAENLENNLEMNKCLHNICMLLLQYGYYGRPLKNNTLGFEPRFEQVLSFFAKCPEYKHEQAYPLLDLGTVKMFEFVDTDDKKFLLSAKRYYSEAQLYAKSFYAQHIAETGLLIVNSYLYAERQPSFVKSLRDKLYKHYIYQKISIEDYRVHRKILLSLALSAIITNEIQEATDYLKQAYPYVTGAETNRYNKLCKKAGCTEYTKDSVSLDGKFETYYASDKFVPWLISLCH